MKNPIEMLNDIAAEITENASLLEVIYRINEFSPEADNTIACLIRSMLKTSQTAYEYVEQLSIHAGAECQRGQKLESPTALANQLNSWLVISAIVSLPFIIQWMIYQQNQTQLGF